MFLDDKLTRSANNHVKNSDDHANPVFRRTAPGLVELGGSILRYSTTTPAPGFEPIPGGYRKRASARAALAQIAKAARA
jgi:hypothetical protein